MNRFLVLAALLTGCTASRHYTDTPGKYDKHIVFPVPRASDVKFEPSMQSLLEANSAPRNPDKK